MKQDKIEQVVVFKKGTEIQDAQLILDKDGIAYRQGMDSSRGKLYFYKTGPKFILTFATEQEKDTFVANYQNSEYIYEIYTPDWTKQKD